MKFSPISSSSVSRARSPQRVTERDMPGTYATRALPPAPAFEFDMKMAANHTYTIAPRNNPSAVRNGTWSFECGICEFHHVSPDTGPVAITIDVKNATVDDLSKGVTATVTTG